MYGPKLQLDPPLLQALGERLEAALGQQVNVAEVEQVAAGANSRTHFVALRHDGPPIGIKFSGRGVPNGNEKERLVAKIALTLKVPNSCQTVEVTVQEIPALSGRSANAIVWLENAPKLADLKQTDVAQIKADPRGYLFQYGQWMALGLLLGVKDRGTQNWVWAPAQGRLAMIDNEECLQQGIVQDFYMGIDLIADRAALKNSGPMAKPGSLLTAGLRAVQKRFRARRSEIEEMFAMGGFASGYRSHFMELSPRTLAETVFSTLA